MLFYISTQKTKRKCLNIWQHKVAFKLTLGISFEEKLSSDPRWIFLRTRRHVPKPSILLPLMENLINTFTKTDQSGLSLFVDPVTLAPLFNPKSVKEFKELLPHVKHGCLSDPKNIPLYYEKKICSHSGLMIYRCVRGTSSLEGAIHQKVFTLNLF